jgi:ferrous iron transport protein B
MSVTASRRAWTVALIGNPNTGKSTLFTALAGIRQHTGNYPGVTVEKKTGTFTHGGRAITVVDLPGTYSLAPRSLDEMVAVDELFGRGSETARPDAVVCIVDASNLERNLYLVSQVLELGLPTVVALNMIDAAEARGVTIDAAKLSERLGVAVVPLQAHRGVGVDRLREAVAAACNGTGVVAPNPFPRAFQDEVSKLEELSATVGSDVAVPRYLAERLLLDTSGYLQERIFGTQGEAAATAIREARERLAKAGLPVPAVEAMARYGWVGKLLEGVVERRERNEVALTDRIDRVLTHRLWGTLFFALMMVVVFQAVFTWAGPLMDLIGEGVDAVSDRVAEHLTDGPLKSLVVDGVLAGVGGVVVFLPQIMILFLFIGLLEDCGYMARAAYLMDKLMVRVGLSGKSFIPLLSSFACAIPGVMATRVIENRRDRFTTMMVAPLMSCSARLPVYTLMIAAFVPARAYLGGVLGLQGLVMFSMYLVGILTAVVVALLLKRTLLRGPTPPFVMELPSYKMPSPRTVFFRMLDRGWAFLKNAGTLILAVSIVVWAALYYPHDGATVEAPYRAAKEAAEAKVAATQPGVDASGRVLDVPESQRAEFEAARAELAEIEMHLDGAYKRQSYLGRAGHLIEPLVRPLGWDWRIGSAAIASFPAREVVVATLGILFDVGGEVDVDVDEDRGRLQSALENAKWEGTDRPLFTLATALSIMVFFALCAQCAATLAVIKRETNSWRWPLFTFTYMTGLAYLAAFVVYQTTVALGG